MQALTAELESLGVFHPLSQGFALLDALRGVKTIKQSGSNAGIRLKNALAISDVGERVSPTSPPAWGND